MNVSVPAAAPTTPPDIGASTKWPEEVAETVLAIFWEVDGSMVEWSMKRRWSVGDEGRGSGEESMESKMEVTCVGEGRARWMVVCSREEGRMVSRAVCAAVGEEGRRGGG